MKKLWDKSYSIILICIVELFFLCLYFAMVAVDAPNYQIIRWGEKTYFSFKDRSYLNDFNWYLEKGSQEDPRFYFDSLEEAHHKLHSGTFTEEELKKIRLKTQDRYGRIELFNIDNLAEPVLPESYTCSRKVQWAGTKLAYTISGDGPIEFASFSIIPKSEYKKHSKEWNNFLKDSEDYEVESVERIPHRNTTVFYCRNKHNDRLSKFITYSVKTENKTLLVTEEYLNDEDMVPNNITLYGNQDGCYFRIGTYQMEEATSPEWISQFGIQKWEG